MADRPDRLGYERIAEHASIRQEKSQVSEAHVHSGHMEASTYEAYAYPSYSSCMRRVSPTDASLPPSSHRRHISPI